MILYPAMDLMNGRIVRLRQGRFSEAKVYRGDPRDALASFADAGAQWIHIVDLDGARCGKPVQHDLIAGLAQAFSPRLQVGGGIRSQDQVERLFDAGVERVVVGSVAVRQPDLFESWLDRFGPGRITLALDVRTDGDEPEVAVSGWTEKSGMSLWEVAGRFPAIEHLLLTDISRDGELAGPNLELLDEAVERLDTVKIQASGGVSSLADIGRLKTHGAIIGKALWEQRIDLREALRHARA